MADDPYVVRIENEHISLALAPNFGARIIELIDKRSGRNWVIPSEARGSPSPGEVYGAAQAKGWDECFPTVAANARCDEIWGAPSRDHGELWDRRWGCARRDDGADAVFRSERFVFRRNVRLAQNKLRVFYELENCGTDEFAYMWSQHCLLKAAPGEEICLAGFGDMEATFCTGKGCASLPSRFHWPPTTRGLPDLTRVHDVDCGFALKAYAPVRERARASVGGPGGALRFEWTRDSIPYLGLWLDYGGWPEEGPVQQIALEPTTAMADSLDAAKDKRQARTLKSAGKHQWALEIALFQSKDEMDSAA